MNNFSDLIEKYVREKQEKKGKDLCVKTWIDSASKRAAQITLATHVIKFSNSEAKGTSVCVTPKDAKVVGEEIYLTTGSLREIPYDFVGNAASMDVAGFLSLEFQGRSLLDLITAGDASPFAVFAESSDQLEVWMNGFKAVFNQRQLSSHTLAKQVYFPVGKNEYHLLAPLYPAAIAHDVFEKVNRDRYGEMAKETRDAKKKEIYSKEKVVDYPHLVTQMFGGTKPQNISRLNSLRAGKSYLIKSAPPIWKSVKKPPMTKREFWREYKSRVYIVLREFRAFLLEINDYNNFFIRRKIASFVDQLLDLLLQTAAEIQSMKTGWSVTSKIPKWEQLWLDPFREDFIIIRETDDWMQELAECFGRFVCDELNGKEFCIVEVHYEYFKNECLKTLKSGAI
jgi:CRISPR-associated protein Csy1